MEGGEAENRAGGEDSLAMFSQGRGRVGKLVTTLFNML